MRVYAISAYFYNEIYRCKDFFTQLEENIDNAGKWYEIVEKIRQEFASFVIYPFFNILVPGIIDQYVKYDAIHRMLPAPTDGSVKPIFPATYQPDTREINTRFCTLFEEELVGGWRSIQLSVCAVDGIVLIPACSINDTHTHSYVCVDDKENPLREYKYLPALHRIKGKRIHNYHRMKHLVEWLPGINEMMGNVRSLSGRFSPEARVFTTVRFALEYYYPIEDDDFFVEVNHPDFVNSDDDDAGSEDESDTDDEVEEGADGKLKNEGVIIYYPNPNSSNAGAGAGAGATLESCKPKHVYIPTPGVPVPTALQECPPSSTDADAPTDVDSDESTAESTAESATESASDADADAGESVPPLKRARMTRQETPWYGC